MSHQLLIRPEAETDLKQAFDWYENQRAGLGDEFLLTVEAALSLIGRVPEAFPVVHLDIRRALLRRFPYGVFYRVEGPMVIVLAVFHARRNPRRWRRRQ